MTQLETHVVQSKEHCDSLIAQINAKSVENSNLNAQLQEKDFAITALKNELRKLKRKNVVDITVSKPNATIAPGMFKLDIEPISHRLKNNRDAHEVYIEKTIETTDTLLGFVERARTHNPSKPLLESACMFTKHIQELLVYVSQTCPNLPKPSEKLVAVTPMNKDKRVRFAKPVTSSSNIAKQTDSLKTKDSNKPLLTSTGVKPTTNASGSKPSSNTKNNRITRPPRSNQKNKVEDHSRKVKSSLNKMNSVSEPVNSELVKHSVRNAKFEYICSIYNKYLFDDNHDMCIIDYVNNVNKPTGRTFTIVGNRCPLTRITSTKVVPTKETSTKSVATPTQLSKLFSGTIRFRNDHIAKNMGYGDYQIGNVTIARVYYVEGLGLVRGLPKLKYQIDHLCSAYALGKSKKHSHKPKAKDSIQEKLYLLHMDLYSPMRIPSINGRKYILVIVDDYSRTDNGTEFVNHTLKAYYEEVGISHQTSVARTPQQNGVAVATACFIQNRSLIRNHHNKKPYELLHDRKPNLSYLHVFGALCYPTNDDEDLGKLKPKADIGIFFGYAPTKKAFRIYNKRTRMIIETIHVDFNELSAMVSKQLSSGPGPKLLTLGTISSGLVQNIPSSTP
ncbi:retrovirus-related pol polyprotein from transposon TNT 1-94, partial [Tanacetum coccineum]